MVFKLSWEYIPIYVVIVIIAVGLLIACYFCRRANRMAIGQTRDGHPAAVAGMYNSRGPVLSGVHSSPASTPTPVITPYPSFNSAHAPSRPRSRAPSETTSTFETQDGYPAAVAGVYNSRGPVLSGVHSSPASTPTPVITPYPSFNSAHAPSRPRSRAPSETTSTPAPEVTRPAAAVAPPSYHEAMDSVYDPQPSAPLLEEAHPPPYASVAAANLPDTPHP